MATIVERVYEDSTGVLKALEGDLSLSAFANDHLRKLVLLSAASHFEHLLSEAMLVFAHAASRGHDGVVSIIRAKAVERQYHTWFDWKNKSANGFYRILGEEFGARLKERVKADETLKEAERAFLDLGSLRNQLVHRNFAVFPLDKTTDEVFALYEMAQKYVSTVIEYLADPHSENPPKEVDK